MRFTYSDDIFGYYCVANTDDHKVYVIEMFKDSNFVRVLSCFVDGYDWENAVIRHLSYINYYN